MCITRCKNRSPGYREGIRPEFEGGSCRRCRNCNGGENEIREFCDEPAAPAKKEAAGRGASRIGAYGFPLLLSIGVIDSATRMAFLTFLPFVLTAKGASLPTVGLALTLVFAGGAAGKLVCAWIGARIGTVATVWLTETVTAWLVELGHAQA